MSKSLKTKFLAHVGYVLCAGESASQAFDRLRAEDPDLFPVPRANESFWDAIRECVGEGEPTGDFYSEKYGDW